MKKTKGNRSSKKGTRKNTAIGNQYISDPSRKLNVEVDWNSADGGFTDLQNRRVFQFLTRNLGAGYNLIQTQPGTHFYAHGKTKLHLQAVKVKEWPRRLTWWSDDRKVDGDVGPLSCSSYNEWIKTPPCQVGSKREKIFLKMKSNAFVGGFATYLWRMFSGEIDERKHKVFVKALKSTFKKKPIFINNEDVAWFHAKENVHE